MDICQTSPSETVMVGDSAVDIEAGKAAGVTTCGILGGFRPAGELESSECDLIINNLLELVNHFGPPKKRLQNSGCRLQVTGYRLQVTGCRLQVAGYRLQVAGFSATKMHINSLSLIQTGDVESAI
jgi:hypothetical protein